VKKHFVYIIEYRTAKTREVRYYIGSTGNVKARRAAHEAGDGAACLRGAEILRQIYARQKWPSRDEYVMKHGREGIKPLSHDDRAALVDLVHGRSGFLSRPDIDPKDWQVLEVEPRESP
jgi:predicted GIY-YIG superfamily endonuclease